MLRTAGMDDLKLKDILFEWDEPGQNNLSFKRDFKRDKLEEARRQQWRREFLNLGEVLKAYDYLATSGIAPIVKLDEFEKLPKFVRHSSINSSPMVMLPSLV